MKKTPSYSYIELVKILRRKTRRHDETEFLLPRTCKTYYDRFIRRMNLHDKHMLSPVIL